MAKGKPVRRKGKIRFSEYFKKLKDGDMVSVVAEKSVCSSFPKRIQGLTGKVVRSQGSFKVVELKDKDKTKTFIMHPVHLRKN
ncbi:50S ribosomal protein L21e [archaeon]|jgi:large subunit ribosomal protein L21e|nr:50S ribosomal protein L21e [archaeon]